MENNTYVDLGEFYNEFINSEIASGRYKSAREIIISGLNLLQLQRQKLNVIIDALEEGEKSGPYIKFNNEKFKEKMKLKFHKYD